jgi:hypothetical protein
VSVLGLKQTNTRISYLATQNFEVNNSAKRDQNTVHGCPIPTIGVTRKIAFLYFKNWIQVNYHHQRLQHSMAK